MTNRASRSHSDSTAAATVGSRRMRALAATSGRLATRLMGLRVQDFGNPALDDALAVGARVIGVDRKELGVLEHDGKTGIECNVGMRRHEVDFVFRKLALHRGRGRP